MTRLMSENFTEPEHSIRRISDDNSVDLQNVLEHLGVFLNEGQCDTYNICRYCSKSKLFFDDGDTPCADAYLKMIKRGRGAKEISIWHQQIGLELVRFE